MGNIILLLIWENHSPGSNFCISTVFFCIISTLARYSTYNRTTGSVLKLCKSNMLPSFPRISQALKHVRVSNTIHSCSVTAVMIFVTNDAIFIQTRIQFSINQLQ